MKPTFGVSYVQIYFVQLDIYHGLQTMNERKVGGIVDPSCGLNNLRPKQRVNLTIHVSSIPVLDNNVRTLFSARNCSPVTPVTFSRPSSYALWVSDRKGKYGGSYKFKNVLTVFFTNLIAL